MDKRLGLAAAVAMMAAGQANLGGAMALTNPNRDLPLMGYPRRPKTRAERYRNGPNPAGSKIARKAERHQLTKKS